MQDAVNDIERNQKGVQSKGGVKAGLDVKIEEEVMSKEKVNSMA